MEMNGGKQMLKICTTGFNATSRNEELLKEVAATNPGQRRSLEIQFLTEKMISLLKCKPITGKQISSFIRHVCTPKYDNIAFVYYLFVCVCIGIVLYCKILHVDDDGNDILT